jgi:BirA family biotin operon repressor/biotin-[acetyl-CoA-carboxylase] ligase
LISEGKAAMSRLEVDIVINLRSSQRYFSMEELSKTSGVTIEKVGEAIRDLKGRGYRIDEVPGEGVRLLGTPTSLDGSDIKSKLDSAVLARDIFTFGVVGSTNDVASALAKGGARDGALVVAEEQTKGRGRQGRTWHSPPGSGLWFSLVLRPDIEGEDAGTVSLAAALGVADAMQADYGVRSKIKWPNDVMVRGRKLCGILTEAEFAGSKVSFVILGVGINVLGKVTDFPAELSEIATTLQTEAGGAVSRSDVLVSVIHSIEARYLEVCKKGFPSLKDDLLERSTLIGKLARVQTGNGLVEGVAVAIDDRGALVLRSESGVMRRVVAGEVISLV